MNKKIYAFVELLHAVQHFLFFYALAIAVQSMDTASAVNYRIPLWIAGGIAVAHLSRRMFSNLLFVLGMQMLVAVLVLKYLSPTAALTVANLITVVTLFILMMWARKNPWGYAIEPFTVLSSIFFPIYYMLARYYEHFKEGQVIAGACLLFLMVSYVERYLANLNGYIKEDRSISLLDVRKLVKVNAGMLAVFLAAMLLGAALFLKIFPLDPLWKLFGMLIMLVIKLVMQVIYFFDNGEPLESTAPEWEEMEQILVDEPGNNTIAKLILGIIVLYYVIRFLYRLYQYFKNATAAPEDIVIYHEPKETKGKTVKKKIRKERMKGENAQKVRRLYKRLVKSHRRTYKVLRDSHTAQLISTNMEREDSERNGQQRDYREVTKLYEKARYSKEMISEEEVRRMKEKVR